MIVYATITAMLNPFPELLVFGLLAPFVLRLAVGALFLRSAWRHREPRVRERMNAELAGFKLNMLGRQFPWYLVSVEAVVGGMLIVGFFTQIAALVGIVASVKFLFFRRHFPTLADRSVAYYMLVIAICASLMLSGAGALAVDLPL